MSDGFVEAYAKTTGEKHWIPEHYLGDPVLGANFALTPSGREQQLVDDGPSLDWGLPELKAHADALGVDRTGLRSKDDVLAAIEAHVAATEPAPAGPLETPDTTGAGQGDDVDGTPTTTDTPATGDDPKEK